MINNDQLNIKLRNQYRQKIQNYWNRGGNNADEWLAIEEIKSQILENESNKSKKFYRYKSFKDWSPERLASEIEDIKSGQITLIHPTEFNDPYDCRLSAGVALNYLERERSNPKIFREKIRQHVNEDILAKNFTDQQKASIADKMFISQLSRSNINHARKIVDDIKKIFRIACFATRPDDMYFWSHYGDVHKGYCIEYEFGDTMFQYLHPVDYARDVPHFELDHSKYSIALIKSHDWAKEMEWRLLSKSGEDDLDYDEPIKKFKMMDAKVSAIYLGLDFEKSITDSYVSKRSDLLRCFSDKKIFQIELQDDNFQLGFREFN